MNNYTPINYITDKMEKFQKLLNLNEEEIENLHRLITNKEIQLAMNNIPTKKSPRPIDLMVNSTKF